MPHIPVTHVGSMPRGEALTPLLLARDKGEPYDAEEFDRVVTQAVTDCVAMQRECGVISSATANWARSAIRPT